MELIVTVGAVGCGKSTYAESLVKNSKGKIVQVNRDDIRKQLFGIKGWRNYKFTKEKENLVTKTQYEMIKAAIEIGVSVIVSDTNLSYRQKLIDFAIDFDVKYREVWFPVSLDELHRRNEERQAWKVPTTVVESMFEKFTTQFEALTIEQMETKTIYIQKQQYKAPEYDATAPDAVIFDLDGTLALMGNRGPYDTNVCDDKPNALVVKQALNEQSSGKKLIFMSGRVDTTYEDTKAWLEQQGLKVENLFMRVTGDFRSDVIVKEELFRNNVANEFNVLYAVDDRDSVVSAWRKMGLTCWQVANGNF